MYEHSEIEEFNHRFFAGETADKLSPIIDIAAYRFITELELAEEDKIDFKIKAKQFVKIYGQVACIIPFNNLNWEKLYWFLKFLIPKLPVKDPNQDQLDKLLNSIDLSTYGLERVNLNYTISLEGIIKKAITQERKRELDLYKRYTADPEFQRAFDAAIVRILSQELDFRQDAS